jgi:hypothetical protein
MLWLRRLLIEILDYFQIEPPSLFHAGRGQNGADGPGRPALLAYYFSQVGLVHAQFQDGGLFTVDLSHRDLIRIVNQCSANSFN